MSQLTLERLNQGHLWHVRGKGAADSVRALSVPAPEQRFRYQAVGERGFVATLGRSEFLLFDDGQRQLSTELSINRCEETKIFPRDDSLFILKGEGWQSLLLQVCAFDFSQTQAGEMVMANMAGVSAWFRVAEEQLVFGCDPSYGHYLWETLTEIVAEGKEARH